jgi:hypothetical protein
MTSDLGTVGDYPGTGIVPVSDSRFATHDIRLASALCPLGFALKLDSQPVAVTLDADRPNRPIITFFHQDESEIPALRAGKISARTVELWWSSPGKYEIEGYDDALMAMHRVHIAREAMISLSKSHNGRVNQNNGQVATRSLHTASIIGACEINPIGYEASTRRWIFGKGAEVISDLIKDFKTDRPNKSDICIDWMRASLTYRDWMAQMVRDPECIPLIEMKDGKKILQISSAMPEKEQRKWMSFL